ncbi:MAG TPA: diadenylate cyclase CdaA [Desulfuromonadaceae bacterium]
MPSFIRLQDVADILIMTCLLYQLYSWFRKTRAIQVLLGLGVVTLIYFATRFLGLYMTSWVLQELGTVLIVLIIVVFQSEIRQALYRFSLLRYLFDNPQIHQQSQFQELSETVFDFASKKIGAILVFQRNELLNDLMLNGVRLDCELSPQILEAIFTDGTPLHDGAALINNNRIVQAACHLPLSTSPELPQFLGTRHRAALGLTERTDAVVVVVSEERGEVSLAVGGDLQRVATEGDLIVWLDKLINPVRAAKRLPLRVRLFSNLLPKLTILLTVIIFWALITSRQGQIATIAAQVRLHGLPDELVLLRGVPEEVDVQVKSYSSLTPSSTKLDISADIDLSSIREGQSNIRIRNTDFNLPSGMAIMGINPSTIKIVAEKKVRKTVPVKVMLRGSLGKSLKGYEAVSEPAQVMIEGPTSQVSRIESLGTEECDATHLTKGREYSKSLQAPLKRVVILRDEPVVIKLVSRKNRQLM